MCICSVSNWSSFLASFTNGETAPSGKESKKINGYWKEEDRRGKLLIEKQRQGGKNKEEALQMTRFFVVSVFTIAKKAMGKKTNKKKEPQSLLSLSSFSFSFFLSFSLNSHLTLSIPQHPIKTLQTSPSHPKSIHSTLILLSKPLQTPPSYTNTLQFLSSIHQTKKPPLFSLPYTNH